jgi:hypothetical protein
MSMDTRARVEKVEKVIRVEKRVEKPEKEA